MTSRWRPLRPTRRRNVREDGACARLRSARRRWRPAFASTRSRAAGAAADAIEPYDAGPPIAALAPLGLALAALPTAVAVGLLRRGDAPFGSVHDAMYLWPPAQLCDFFLGVVAAELAATHAARPRWRLAAPAADASCLAVAALVLCAPNPGSRYRTGFEELFDHGLAPRFAGRETKICNTTSIFARFRQSFFTVWKEPAEKTRSVQK